MSKIPVPAIDGWFTQDDPPHLLGTKCKACGSIFFPRENDFCRNPACTGSAFEEVPLSRTGRLWSFTNSCYPPPPPFIAKDPFEPYALAAVELEAEKMVVLGQVVEGLAVEDLEAGMEMEVVLETLYEDDDHAYSIWKWRPTA